MKSAAQTTRPPNALDIVEQAVALLRSASAADWVLYYSGAAPFLLALLFYCNAMLYGAYPQNTLSAGAFGVALAYVWMCVTQAATMQRWRDRLLGAAAMPWDRARLARLLVLQGTLQPLRLIVVPLAALAALPLAVTVAWFDSLALEDGALATACRNARRQAALWPTQNWLVLIVAYAFKLVLFVNAAALLAMAPWALKTFTGVETGFTRAGSNAVANATFLMTAGALTYALGDPLRRAIYVVRCFRGASLQSGADLRAALRAVSRVALVCLLAAPIFAAQPPLNVRELNDRIETVSARPDFAWRMPRTEAATNQSAFAKAMTRALEALAQFGQKILDGLKRFFEWLRDVFFSSDARRPDMRGAPSAGIRAFNWTLAAVAVIAICLIGWQMRRSRKATVVTATSLAVRATQLNLETVDASEQPEDEWLRTARQMAGTGDMRLALRAFYLASLASLNARGLLTLHRGKSNRDYLGELRRRARERTALHQCFAGNIALYERSWYGDHEATAEALAEFETNFERMRRHAQ